MNPEEIEKIRLDFVKGMLKLAFDIRAKQCEWTDLEKAFMLNLFVDSAQKSFSDYPLDIQLTLTAATILKHVNDNLPNPLKSKDKHGVV